MYFVLLEFRISIYNS